MLLIKADLTSGRTTVSGAKLLKAQQGKCFYCRKKLRCVPGEANHKPHDMATRDHFLPKSMGYRLNGNKVMACESCNTGKGSKFPSLAEIQRAANLYKGLSVKFIFVICYTELSTALH